MQFVVLPIGYTDTHKSQAFRADPSFLSNRTAMAFILKLQMVITYRLVLISAVN